MTMENVQTKVPNNRRGKFFVVILVVIILMLSFHIYREHNFKKNLVRRKAFLIAMLRESKVNKGKMSLQIASQEKDLAGKQKEIQEVQRNLDETTRSYQQQAERLNGLQESATEHKNSLDALQKQYDDASSAVKTVKDKLERTIASCEDSNNKNTGLNKDIKSKVFALEECLQEKGTLSKEKQDMENNYKRQMSNLSQHTQSIGTTGLQSNVNPLRETIYNQHRPLDASPHASIGDRRSNLSPSNTGGLVSQTHDDYLKQAQQSNLSPSNTGGLVSQTRNDYPKQAYVPVESQITTSTRFNKAIEPGTGSETSNSNTDSTTTHEDGQLV